MKLQRHVHMVNEKNSPSRPNVLPLISVPSFLFIVFFILVIPPQSAVQASRKMKLDLITTVVKVPGDIKENRRWSALSSGSGDVSYAVVFDAGSSGSRVHVYSFDDQFELVPIGDDLEIFTQVKPGLSAYAENPDKAVNSLKPLLDEAIEGVPEEIRSETPLRLGATAGLRLLPGDSAENILEAVRNYFSDSPFKFQSDWVSILTGTQEGAYEWVTVNYLLGNIGNNISKTVGIVDLGGGSVQMAYAISDEAAKNAPTPADGEDAYVTEFNLLGNTYELYVHSYLNYGLLAARAEVLKLVQDNETNPCLAKGFDGEYVYNSASYPAVGSASGGNFDECQKLILKALDIDHACDYEECTFGGVWNGGGGDGQKKLYLASFFFDKAVEAGIINDADAVEGQAKAVDFETVGRKVCPLGVDEIGELYPNVDEGNRPYFCLDLVYEYTLLVNGFGVNKTQEVTLIQQIIYKGYNIATQWTLGSAIELLSS